MNCQLDLTEKEFRLLQDLIHQWFGILFKEEKRSFIKMKLHSRVMGLGLQSFSEYIQFLKFTQEGEREISHMISLLTNTETYFFREMPQLEVFRDSLLPEIREKKLIRNEKQVTILSAGCSTGEEPYTLAMLAYESGSFLWGWNLQIIGMDINERAIEIARKGVYYDRSFRMTDPESIKKFFTANSGDFSAKDSIRKMTTFISGNIAQPLTVKDIDIILCRNVLIYFSEDKMKAAIRNFNDALRPGGYLLLGHSETLTGISDAFDIRRFPETIIYQKRG